MAQNQHNGTESNNISDETKGAPRRPQQQQQQAQTPNPGGSEQPFEPRPSPKKK